MARNSAMSSSQRSGMVKWISRMGGRCDDSRKRKTILFKRLNRGPEKVNQLLTESYRGVHGAFRNQTRLSWKAPPATGAG